MGKAEAERWNSAFAAEAADRISSIPSLYCGPAAVAWIASVWNQSKGRKHDLPARLTDKTLFADGPRAFHGVIPGFQESLNELLLRETSGDLMLANETYFRLETIHRVLAQYHMPIIIRTTGPRLKDGLHYVTLYRSEFIEGLSSPFRIDLSVQDNGLLAKRDGFAVQSFTNRRHIFIWGAKRVALSQ